MIAAIYARRSHEQNVAEDAKSVTRQLELGRAFAAEQGWTVVGEYTDDEVSEALSTKLVSRARLLADAADEKFSVVIVRDYDRLSRDDREGPSFIYALQDCGGEIWYYADRSRVDTRTALHSGMLSMKATFAAAEREAAQQRTREAMRAKAKAGHVAGGVVFGYQTSESIATLNARSLPSRPPSSGASSRRSLRAAAFSGSRTG
jgi:site-specific DNA recombinase